MTEKIHLETESNEYQDPNPEQQTGSLEISETALKELEEERLDIAFRQSETAEEIRKAQVKKGKEVEKFEGVVFKTPSHSSSNGLRNKFMAGVITVASILGFGNKAKAGEPIDSLGKKTTTERMVGGIEVKEGLKIRELTNKDRQDWNKFIDFVQQKAEEIGGLEKLDKGSDALARSLFKQYEELVGPNNAIKYEDVGSFQYEMQKLRESAQGFAKRHNDPNADNLMNFVSKVDGWFGSRTSKSKFPFMVETQYHNDNLVSSENLGLVNSKLEPEKIARMMRNVPRGAKTEQLADGLYYKNDDGDLIKVLDK